MDLPHYAVILHFTTEENPNTQIEIIRPFKSLTAVYTYYSNCLKHKINNKDVNGRYILFLEIVTINKIFQTNTVSKRSSDTRPKRVNSSNTLNINRKNIISRLLDREIPI